VCGDDTVRELCRRHEIRYPSYVYAKAHAQGWAGKREDYRDAERARARTPAERRALRRAAQEAALDAAVATVRAASTTLNALLEERHVVDYGGQFVEEPVLWIDPADVGRILRALTPSPFELGDLERAPTLGAQLRWWTRQAARVNRLVAHLERRAAQSRRSAHDGSRAGRSRA
jgi:hypothetical protein